MQMINLPLAKLRTAPWNANRMDPRMVQRLRESIRRYGLVENLVVRPIEEDVYEVIGGNWRLKVLSEMNSDAAPCVVVEVDDAHARILAQALNRIEGEDDQGLRAELVKKALESIPQEEILSILPETAESLQALASLGEEDMASYLQNWERAQATRLKHYQFQLMASQVDIVEEALSRIMPRANMNQGESPNVRGTALYLLCKAFLEKEGGHRE